MGKIKFKKVVSTLSLLALTTFTGLFVKNQASAINPEINIMQNQEYSIIDINIVRPGSQKNLDSIYFQNIMRNISKYIYKDTSEVRVYFFSPNPSEEDINDIEYFACSYFVVSKTLLYANANIRDNFNNGLINQSI